MVKYYFTRTKEWINAKFTFKSLLEALKVGAYELTIKNQQKIRSLDHNSWYWSILHFLENNSDVWYTADEWHEVFKSYFLSEEKTVPNTNISYKIIKSTTNLSTK